MFFYFLKILILVISLTTDAFSAGISYGAGKIKIPIKSLFVISLICSFMLACSMICGEIFSSFINPELSKYLAFIILFILGFTRLFDLILKNYIKNRQKINLHFSMFSLNFILTVYADAKLADADNSKTISIKEAATLAIALSLDGLAVGFGVALGDVPIISTVFISLIMTSMAIKIGEITGNHLQSKIPFDLSYLSALLLISLAFLRL